MGPCWKQILCCGIPDDFQQQYIIAGHAARDRSGSHYRLSRSDGEMSTDAIIPGEKEKQRYEAVLRISEALSSCDEPELLARTLAGEMEKFLPFDHLYLLVLKENSREIEYR